MFEVSNKQKLYFKKLKVRVNREQINNSFVDMILPPPQPHTHTYTLWLIDNYVGFFKREEKIWVGSDPITTR